MISNEWRRNVDASHYQQKIYPSKLALIWGWGFCALATAVGWMIIVWFCAWKLGFPTQPSDSRNFVIQYELYLQWSFLALSGVVMFAAYFKYKIYGLHRVFMETLIRILIALILALILGAVMAFFASRSN